MTVDAPDSASAEEVAAVLAAVETHLSERRALAAAAARAAHEDAPSWEGEKWRFAGRLDAVGARSGRVPDGAPTDAWSAAGRAERF